MSTLSILLLPYQYGGDVDVRLSVLKLSKRKHGRVGKVGGACRFSRSSFAVQ